MQEITITNKQQVVATLLNSAGASPVVQGIPVWSVVSGTSTFVVAPDGLSATLVSSDDVGDTVYHVDAVVSNTDGTTSPAFADATLHVTAGSTLEELTISFGTPTNK